MNKTAELILQDDIEDVYVTGTQHEAVDSRTNAEKKIDAIAQALSEDTNAFLNVSRQTNGGTSPMEFVGRFPADKFDFGQLQAHLQITYGGGDYRCMLYACGKVRANKLLTIATPKITDTNRPTPTGELGQFMTGVLDRMETMQNNMIQMMQGNQSGSNSRQDFMQEMMLMKQFFANDNPQAANNPMTQIKEMFEMQALFKESIVGDGKEVDDGFGSLLEKASPLFEAIANTAGKAPQKQEPSLEQKQAHLRKQQQKQIIGGIKQLIMLANCGGDPGAAAEMVLEKLPEQVIQHFVVAPDALEKVAKIVPEVRPVGEWFLLMGEHVKALLGLPSTVSEQYDDGLTENKMSDSVAESVPDTETAPENETDLHTSSDS